MPQRDGEKTVMWCFAGTPADHHGSRRGGRAIYCTKIPKTEDAGMDNDYHLSIKCLDFSFFPEYNLQTILRFRNLIKYCIEQEQISFD